MAGDNKHESTIIRKKFRKSNNYRCCGAPEGNSQKFSVKYCCTYPMVYKRHDTTLLNKKMSRAMDDEIYVY